MPEYIVNVTTIGTAGNAVGSADTPVLYGFVEAIQFDFHASAPATTDTTVTETSAPGRTLTTLTSTVTDAVKYPRVQATDTSGAAITGVYTRFFVWGSALRFSLAQCDALTDALVARVYVSEC